MKKTCLGLMMVLSPLANADTVVYNAADGKVINAQLAIGGTSYSVDWYLPAATPTALMAYQHGFSRGCGNHRNSALNIMRWEWLSSRHQPKSRPKRRASGSRANAGRMAMAWPF